MQATATQREQAGVAPLSQLLAEDLKACGVEVVFGLLSDDIIDLVTALGVEGIQFCGARHETQAVTMAEGYAFATGRLGVAAVGRGGGSTNALTGAAYAARTGSKVLLIAGDAPMLDGALNAVGPDIKRLDALGTGGMFAAVGLRVYAVSSAELARPSLAAAVIHAERGRESVLLVPTNVLAANVDAGEQSPPRTASLQPPALPASQAAIDTAVAVLQASRRPLIVGGWGAFRAGAREPLEELAERLGAVLATTLKGKDLFRGNAFDLGVLGSFSHSAARRLVDQADCVLVVGAGLNLFTMSHGCTLPAVPIVHLDADRAHIGRWTTVHASLVGDARVVTEQLLEAIPERPAADKPFRTEETRAFLAQFEHTHDFTDATRPRNIDPRSLALVLDEVLPPERTVVWDAGNFIGTIPYIAVPDPHHVKMTSETGAIGLGFGTALGVARGRPESATVLMIGDGGLLMQLGELETAVREDLPLIIVVMNDRAYGAERHFLELKGLPLSTSVFPEADFAAVAGELGLRSLTVASLEDARGLADVLSDLDGPILLDCLIDPAVRAPFIAEIAELH